MSCELKQIDGSILEGGGQILRIALTLSVIKRIPVRIFNIRAGRSKPGLMEQHLKGVLLLRDISNGRVEGASLGSTEVKLWPGEITGGSYEARVKTAGSISLLLQAALPCSLFAKSNITLRLFGGTNAQMAPQIDYMTEVFRPILENFGATFYLDLKRRGYFPKGGGEVVIDIEPIEEITPINLTNRGDISSIYGWSFVAGTLPANMANTIGHAALQILKPYHKNTKIEQYKEDRNIAPDNCAGALVVAETSTGCILGGSALSSAKTIVAPEQVGVNAAKELVEAIEEKCCLDTHSQDQVIVFMALAKGSSSVKVGEITMHTKTAIHIAEEMTKVKFHIVPEGKCNIISCDGIK